MRVLIDARLFGPKHTGIGRYSQNLVNNLVKLAPQHQFILITHDSAQIDSQENLSVIKTKIGHYGFSEQLKLIQLINSQKPDLVHFTHFNHPIFYNKPFVVTIHDLIKSEFKDFSASTRTRVIYELKHFVYQKVINHAINKSISVITPSNYSKTRILSAYPACSSQKITAIYEGADQFENIRVKKMFDYKKYSIKDNYCLYIGNSYPYKNLTLAVEAIKKIPELQFVIVSKFNKNLNDIKNLTNGSKQFVFLENLDDAEIASLYQGSMFFLFPSKSEGFGVPGLEAMAMKTPVVCSDAGPLPEIYGDAAIYFNPESVDDLEEKIRFLLKNYKKEKNRLIDLGTKQLKKYSWRKTAEQTLIIYENSINI